MNTSKIEQLRKKKYLDNIKLFSKFGSSKSQAYIYLVATFLSLSILILFAIGPTIGTITELQKKLEDSKIADQALDMKIQNMNILKEQYGSITPYLPLVLSALPADPTVTNLFGIIQAAAKKNGVSIVTLSSAEIPLMGSTPTATGDLSFAFSLTATGNYGSLLEFMNTIANFNRILTISSFSMSRGTASDESESTNRILTIEGEAYYQK